MIPTHPKKNKAFTLAQNMHYSYITVHVIDLKIIISFLSKLLVFLLDILRWVNVVKLLHLHFITAQHKHNFLPSLSPHTISSQQTLQYSIIQYPHNHHFEFVLSFMSINSQSPFLDAKDRPSSGKHVPLQNSHRYHTLYVYTSFLLLSFFITNTKPISKGYHLLLNMNTNH